MELTAISLALSSSLSPSNNASKNGSCSFKTLRSAPLQELLSSNDPSLSFRRHVSCSGLKRSMTRCLLNQNGWRAASPNPGNSKSRRDGFVGLDTVGIAASFAETLLRLRLLFGIWNLVSSHFSTFMNQVPKAFHYLDTVTPFHFTPHVAVGVRALLFTLIWTFGVYKWSKNSGTERPVDVPIQHSDGIGTTNCTGNRHAPTDNRPINGVKEGEALPVQQIVNVSVNVNLVQDGAVPIGTLSNPNRVSTGSVAMEQNILKGVREINQRHTVSLLNALEKGVNRKLHEKEIEIENMNRKNKELGDTIKQVAMEAQSWHYRAKYNESVINVLKSNIQQLMEQGTAQAREGSGDSEVDDAISCSNHRRIISGSGNQGPQNHPPKCRACNGKEVSVLILPCRHLCLCTDCEGFIDVCPICQVMKSTSVRVYM